MVRDHGGARSPGGVLMATSQEYAQYILDQLSESGSIEKRKMFGGVGVYADDVFCAIIGSSNAFFLRVGPGNIDDFQVPACVSFLVGRARA